MQNQISIEGVMMGKLRPMLKTFPSGDPYLRFSILWNGSINGRNMKSFFNVVLHGKLAESFEQGSMWSNGQRVSIVGSLSSWRGQDGKSVVDLICLKLTLIGKTAKKAESAPQKQETKTPDDPVVTEEDEEIPF